MTDFNKAMVDRPEVDGEPLDASDTLGCCLGFGILQNKIEGIPDKDVQDFFKEGPKDYWHPPLIFMLDLEGGLTWFKYFNLNWEEESKLLTDH